MRHDAPLWKQAVAACVVLAALAAWQYGAYRSRLAAEAQQAALEAALSAASVPWAPMMEEVRTMSAWLVEGAGDTSYNGIYEEAGQYGGKPYYQYGAGETARYLLWDTDWSAWLLHTSLTGMPGPPYTGTGANLPANPWSVAFGTPDAPTVSLHVLPPPQPDPNPGAEVPGPPSPIVGPTNFRISPVRPCRVEIGGAEYVVFLGAGDRRLYSYNLDTGASRPMVCWSWPIGDLADNYFRNPDTPHAAWPAFLPVGDGETVWLVTFERGAALAPTGPICTIRAWPLTLEPGAMKATFGVVFEPAETTVTDLALDDANCAWFLDNDRKLYKWDLTGTTIDEIEDFGAWVDPLRGQFEGPRLWYAGEAGKFLRTHSPSAGTAPDYPHLISATEYEWLGDRIDRPCLSYAHRGDETGLTMGIVLTGHSLTRGRPLEQIRYKPGAGDAWDAPSLRDGTDWAWFLRGAPMVVAGANDHRHPWPRI